MTRLPPLLREPLVHFLALGALLFVWFDWKGGSAGPASTRIVVTSGQVQHLAAGYARTWQRPPSEAELKGLLDEYVKEEIAVREAMAMGLERDDTVIRRRLRQKLEFLADESAEKSAPNDAEVLAWVAAHPDAFPSEPKISFRQVFVSTQRRGPLARAEADRLLAKLRSLGPNAPVDEIANLGDPTMLPAETPLGSLREVTVTFGKDFTARLAALETGKWEGPLESAYGLHLVLVTGRALEQLDPALVRPMVERELLAERRQKELQALYERLLAKYQVRIEKSKK
jgi:hypothetical protein